MSQPPNRVRTSTSRESDHTGAGYDDHDLGPADSGWETIVRQHPSKTHYQDGYRELNEWIEQQDQQPELSLAATFPHQLRFRRRQDSSTVGQNEESDEVAGTQHATSTVDFAELDKQQSKSLRHEPSQSTHDQSQLNPDAPHNVWSRFRTKHKRVLAEFLGQSMNE
ncbi:hypothetical protein LTR17_009019 [Elasticomyces elasticus]|nr:hypothetical protein LTR17_009019 [Elasticomyces elasticus]